jgi:hypothetical protein
MSRRKRASSVIIMAENRAIGLGKIDPKLDLGTNKTLEALKTKIATASQLLESYNTKLSELDVVQNDLDAIELELTETCSVMLAAVGVDYGKNSNEYELAGGTRKSERKSSARKTKPTTTQ